MKSFIVTGGLGFIGSNLANELSKKNKVIICDDYDQINYGVKKAVDELKDSVKEIKQLNNRLVKIIT